MAASLPAPHTYIQLVLSCLLRKIEKTPQCHRASIYAVRREGIVGGVVRFWALTFVKPSLRVLIVGLE